MTVACGYSTLACSRQGFPNALWNRQSMLRFRITIDTMESHKGDARMDSDKAKKLGEYLRQQREAKGVSARSVATVVGVDIAQIVRLEQGVVASPKADVLAAIVEYLNLPLADVFGLAGYTLPKELPSL